MMAGSASPNPHCAREADGDALTPKPKTKLWRSMGTMLFLGFFGFWESSMEKSTVSNPKFFPVFQQKRGVETQPY